MSKENIVTEGDEITYYVFVKNGYGRFAPQYVTVGETTVEWIFPVPESGVGLGQSALRQCF
jgi:hypothetical protein